MSKAPPQTTPGPEEQTPLGTLLRAEQAFKERFPFVWMHCSALSGRTYVSYRYHEGLPCLRVDSEPLAPTKPPRRPLTPLAYLEALRALPALWTKCEKEAVRMRVNPIPKADEAAAVAAANAWLDQVTVTP